MKDSTKIFVSWFFSWKVFILTKGSLPLGRKKRNSLGKPSTTACFPQLRVYGNLTYSSNTVLRCQDYTSKSLLCWPLTSPVDPLLCCP